MFIKYFIELVLLNLVLVTGAKGDCELAGVCINDVTEADCPEGTYLIENSSIHGCCPACEARAGTNEVCSDDLLCAPGLVCSDDVCIHDETLTETDVTNHGTCIPTEEIYPNCLEDGSWAPVQCKGDEFTGRCFCADTSGNRIFGQMWRSEAHEMTCACSRHRWLLESEGRLDITIHCTPTGDYEPLQCFDGLCWCADTKSGQPTTVTVDGTQINMLPCYSVGQIGEQYLRRCESLVYAQALINKEQSEHGTFFYLDPTNNCDYDGSYGVYQNQNGINYCTGRTGSILGAWQAVAGEDNTMNCNCALDTAVIYPAAGMTQTQTCLSNGNYRSYQMVGGRYYCVDTDGYPTTDYLDELPADNCASYA